VKSIVGRFLRRRTNAMLGAFLVAIFLATALAGVFFTPHDPVTPNMATRLQPPSSEFWFGTDQFGRDVLSRVMVGARESVLISSIAVFTALAAGLSIGATVGFFGGWADRLSVAVLDAVMAFPSLLLALGIMAVVGPSKYGVIVALAVAYTPAVVRVVRGTVLSLREKEFVDASRALGNSDWYTLARHIVPNVVGPLTVLATSLFATALLSESALSFLGLGVPPPAPTWGGMLADAKQFVSSATWLALFPGLAISWALLGINLFGDALRDYFDPRMNAI